MLVVANLNFIYSTKIQRLVSRHSLYAAVIPKVTPCNPSSFKTKPSVLEKSHCGYEYRSIWSQQYNIMGAHCSPVLLVGKKSEPGSSLQLQCSAHSMGYLKDQLSLFGQDFPEQLCLAGNRKFMSRED